MPATGPGEEVAELSGGGHAFGGALYSRNSSLQACTFIFNRANAGSGCYCSNMSFPHGDAMGGAIFNAGALDATACSFSLNWTDAPVLLSSNLLAA